MRLQRLELKNYRRFHAVGLDFDPRVTLLVGSNGAGKTAILDGVAALLDRQMYRYTSWQMGTGLGSGSFPPSDILLEPVEGALQTQTSQALPSSLRVHFEQGGTFTLSYADPAFPGTGRVETDSTGQSGPPNPLPILRYFAAECGVGSSLAHHAPNPLQAYRNALAGDWERVDLGSWFSWREDIRLQDLSDVAERGGDVSSIHDPLLEAMNRQLRAVLDIDRVMYRKKEQQLLAHFEGEPWLPFEMHSQGRRRVVQLVADLTWMAFELNPDLGVDAPQQTPGVVLIDELELHLHPQWQRQLLGKLTEAFPQLQFIVTTHSPQVIAGARPEWLRILSGDEVRGIGHTLGRDSSSLLEDVFGVRRYPSEVRQRYNRGLELVETGDLQGARAIAVGLEAQLGDSDALVQGLYLELQMAIPLASDG